MKSAFAMIGALCCGSSFAGAFVLPFGRPSGSSLAARRTSLRRASDARITSVERAAATMSAVAEPPIAPPAAHEPDRRRAVRAIGSNDDYKSAIAQHEDKLVVIKFYDQFCRACDEIRPRFEKLSLSHPEEHAVFYELEFSASKDLCKQLGIRRLPTVQIYDGPNGRVADLPAGPSRFSDVEERFAEVVSSKAGMGSDMRTADVMVE